RYQSAAELARDIRRFLADLPIIARPASAAYQFRKFARRNRILVAGIAGVVLALVIGVVGTSIGLVRARRAQGAADRSAQQANVEAARAQRTLGFVRPVLTASAPRDTVGR